MSKSGGFTAEGIAQVAHNLYASIQRAAGDEGMPFWHELPPDAWQREDTLRQIDLLRSNPTLSPEDDHEAWRRARLEAGWKYGPERNDKTKENPLLVPWKDLPFAFRARSTAGFKVIRILLGQE